MKTKAREYYGRLCYKDSEEVDISLINKNLFLYTCLQLVKEYPVLWFKEDEYGGWVRVMNLLNINNLTLKDGSGVPAKASAVKATLLEMIKSCILDGADPSIATTLVKPLLFSDLVPVLESMGLVTSLSSTPAPKQSVRSVTQPLDESFRSEVKILSEKLEINFKSRKVKALMDKGDRVEVVETVPGNMEEVGDPFDLGNGNVRFIIDPDSDSTTTVPLIPPSNGDAQTLEEAFSALSSEHDMALGSIKKLKAELAQARARNLQLEDQVASGS